jgi:phosphoribosylformylglycinamidine cyclo-ligase
MTTYKEAGVDIDAGTEAVSRIKQHVRSTFSDNVLTDLGGFGGCFQFPQDKYKQPVLVSSSDGVGTKLKLAFITKKHDTIGQCLVNHCTNDILAVGARPLFFLDYFASGKLDVDVFEDVVSGLAKACRENDCALIGGETAEMPDFYKPGDYDISGTIVGVAEKGEIMPNRGVHSGDLLIGLPSTGLHTNGYSLARKVLLEHYDSADFVESLNATIGDALLAIHKSYLPALDGILHEEWLVGISHVTGGGIIDNTRRILGEGQDLDIDWNSWERPAIFNLIQELGNVPEDDMRHSMNLGIGMILIIKPDGLLVLQTHLSSQGEPYIQLGTVQ